MAAPWRCAIHTFFRKTACSRCGQLRAPSCSTLGVPLSFPTVAVLFRRWTFLATTGPLGAVFELELPVGLSVFLQQSCYLSLLHREPESHSLEAFSPFSCSHSPLSFIGKILNTFYTSNCLGVWFLETNSTQVSTLFSLAMQTEMKKSWDT